MEWAWDRLGKGTWSGRTPGRELPPMVGVTNAYTHMMHCDMHSEMLQMTVDNRALRGFQTETRRCVPRVENALSERARCGGPSGSAPAGTTFAAEQPGNVGREEFP